MGGKKGREEINRRKTAKLDTSIPSIGSCLSASGTEIRWKNKRKGDGRCARTRIGIGVATSCEMFMKARLIYLHSRSADFIALVARPRLDTWTRKGSPIDIGMGRDSVIHLSNYFFFLCVFVFNEYFEFELQLLFREDEVLNCKEIIILVSKLSLITSCINFYLNDFYHLCVTD